MPTERLSMRRIRDVLRLKYEAGLSERAMLAALGISKGAIGSYLSRARAAGLSWPLPGGVAGGGGVPGPLPGGLTAPALERRLFRGPPAAETAASRSVPDWAEVERE